MNKDDQSSSPEYITIGIIRRSRGNKGELLVEPTASDLTNLMAAGEARLVDDQRGTHRPVRVENFWIHNKKSIIKFEGIDSIEAARQCTGCRLERLIEQLKPLEDDEYYVKDLIGLDVKLKTGEVIGKIVNMIPTGAKDVLVIQGPRIEIMIPFTAAFVGDPDWERKELVVTPPDGLLDIYEI